jgi:hypothetical protein
MSLDAADTSVCATVAGTVIDINGWIGSFICYSALNATTGSRRAARMAG